MEKNFFITPEGINEAWTIFSNSKKEMVEKWSFESNMWAYEVREFMSEIFQHENVVIAFRLQ